VNIDDVEKVKESTAAATKEIREDTEEAASCRVRRAVASWKEETHLKSPGVWRGRSGVSRSAEGVFRVELMVTVVVPLLKGEGEALILEECGVELVLRKGGDKDDLKIMCTLIIARARGTLGLAVCNRFDTKEE
jgi:hypothetical protein